MIAANKPFGIIDRSCLQFQLSGIDVRMIDDIGIFIEDKCISRLKDPDVFHLLRQHLIIDLDPDHTDKPVFPVNRDIV